MDTRISLDPKKPGKDQEELYELFREMMVGQDRAIRHLVRRIQYANSIGGRLRDLTKPAGAFFYLGPSGVGKTRLVEVFAYLLFGSFNAIVKIDCSEFQHSHEIARLIGSPPGYVGSHLEPYLSQRRLDYHGFIKAQNDRKITKQIQDFHQRVSGLEERLKSEFEPKAADSTNKQLRALSAEGQKIAAELRAIHKQLAVLEKSINYVPGSYPSILLFDEIEKADPALFNILLQVHDKARLTVNGTTPDGNPEVLFHNTFIFYTSNIAQGQIQKMLSNSRMGFVPDNLSHGKLDKDIYRLALEQLGRSFSTEFLGRIRKENIIVFSPLTKEQVREGLDRLIIPGFLKRFANLFGCLVNITEATRKFLIEESLDAKNKTFGMRALESIFNKHIEENLVLLGNKKRDEGGIIAGDEITIDYTGSGLVFFVGERTAEQDKGSDLVQHLNQNPDGSNFFDSRTIAIFSIQKPE